MYPVYFYNWIKFHVRWYILFTVKKQPFGEEEKLYLMKKHLKPQSKAQWEEMLDKHRDVFFKYVFMKIFKLTIVFRRGLWIKSHAEEYVREQEEKEREEK